MAAILWVMKVTRRSLAVIIFFTLISTIFGQWTITPRQIRYDSDSSQRTIRQDAVYGTFLTFYSDGKAVFLMDEGYETEGWYEWFRAGVYPKSPFNPSYSSEYGTGFIAGSSMYGEEMWAWNDNGGLVSINGLIPWKLSQPAPIEWSTPIVFTPQSSTANINSTYSLSSSRVEFTFEWNGSSDARVRPKWRFTRSRSILSPSGTWYHAPAFNGVGMPPTLNVTLNEPGIWTVREYVSLINIEMDPVNNEYGLEESLRINTSTQENSYVVETITVGSANSAPTIEFLNAPNPSGTNVYITILAQDADGNLTKVESWRDGEPEGVRYYTLPTPGSWVGTPLPAHNVPPGTYTFYARATDTEGLTATISKTITVLVVDPNDLKPTGYLYNGVDLIGLFKLRDSASKSAPVGMTMTISGTAYDLSEIFAPRTSAPRANVLHMSAGTDLSQIFEAK